MMNYIKRIATIGLICFLLGVVGLTVAFVTTNDWNTFNKAASSSHFKFEEKTVIQDSNKTVEIMTDLHDTSVHLERGTTDNIEILYSFNDKKYPVEVKNKNNRIEITREQRLFYFSHFFNMNREAAKVVVKLPAFYNGKLNIETRNANVDVRNINTSQLHTKTTNDRIQLENVQSQNEIVIKTTNGRIQLENVQSQKDMTIETTNASSTLKNVTTSGNLAVESTNGPLTLNKVFAHQLTGGTTNSRLDIMNLNTKGFVVLHSTNGKIEANQIISGDNVKLKTSNSSIYVNNVKAKQMELASTNAQIESKDIYAKKVALHSTNGNIILTNISNPSFTIELLDTYTTNGSELINAKYKEKVNVQ